MEAKAPLFACFQQVSSGGLTGGNHCSTGFAQPGMLKGFSCVALGIDVEVQGANLGPRAEVRFCAESPVILCCNYSL